MAGLDDVNGFVAVEGSLSKQSAQMISQLYPIMMRRLEERIEDSIVALKSVVMKDVMTAIKAMPEPKAGADGRDGADGKDGEPGKDGEQGPAGPAGAADMAEVRRMVDEAVASAVAALPAAENGKDGEPGKDGDPGRDGAPGADGRSITVDDVAPILEQRMATWESGAEQRMTGLVLRAVDRIPVPRDGRDGRDAEPGRPGAPGATGIEAEFDPSKSYERGVLIAHDGGILQSKRGTDPADVPTDDAGWQWLCRGFKGLEVASTGSRGIVLRAMLSGGDVEHEITLPVPIYQGVYKSTAKYEPGDMVTYRGSVWHCNVPNAGIPGTGGDWTLAAKGGQGAK